MSLSFIHTRAVSGIETKKNLNFTSAACFCSAEELEYEKLSVSALFSLGHKVHLVGLVQGNV